MRWTDRQGIAAHFSVSVRSIDALRARRILPAVKVGRIIRFPVEACEQAFRAFEVQSISQAQSRSSQVQAAALYSVKTERKSDLVNVSTAAIHKPSHPENKHKRE